LDDWSTAVKLYSAAAHPGQLLSLDAKGRAAAKRTKPKLIELQTQSGLGRSGLEYEWRRALKPDLGKVRERMSAASRKTAFDAA
jgi:hypothetical protein